MYRNLTQEESTEDATLQQLQKTDYYSLDTARTNAMPRQKGGRVKLVHSIMAMNYQAGRLYRQFQSTSQGPEVCTRWLESPTIWFLKYRNCIDVGESVCFELTQHQVKYDMKLPKQ